MEDQQTKLDDVIKKLELLPLNATARDAAKVIAESLIQKPTIAEAMDVITEALRADYGYWQSWQANIAVAFQDEASATYTGIPIDDKLLNEVSNADAARFLKNLTHKPSPDAR